MRMTRYWMTGCMAIVLLAAGRWPSPQDEAEPGARRDGWVTLTSKYPVDQTIRHIEQAARSGGLPVVARVEAQSLPGGAGSTGRGKVLVLGDPGGQTPVVQSDTHPEPDLPLKVLVHRRADGRTEVRFSDPRQLAEQSAAPRELIDNLALLPQVVRAALG